MKANVLFAGVMCSLVGFSMCTGVEGAPSERALGSARDMFPRGTLYLTFDDRHFSSWEKALPVFAKYDAHATFFVYGSIDAPAIATMRRLAAAGHSLGLHGQGHAYACKTSRKLGMEKYLAQEVMPQLEAVRRAGLKVGSWAYPCSDRDAATDAALLRHFRRLRSGGYWDQTQNGKLAETDELFHTDRTIPPVVTGASAGLAKPTVTGEVCRVLRRLAERGESAVLYAHNIRTDGVHDDHDLKIDELETILAEARRLGVAVRGFDEMPSAEAPSEAVVLRAKDEKCSAVVTLRDNTYCDAEGRPSAKPDVRLEGGLRPASKEL